MPELTEFLTRLGARKDIMLAVMLLAVVFMMVLPLPPFLLDILIAINITISVVLMMMSVYINSPLQFSVFPAVLLITTLFRLALSVSEQVNDQLGQGLDLAGNVGSALFKDINSPDLQALRSYPTGANVAISDTSNPRPRPPLASGRNAITKPIENATPDAYR